MSDWNTCRCVKCAPAGEQHHNGPCRAIAIAADEIERLRAMNAALINARAAAAEVLGRVACKLPVTCCECVRVLMEMQEAGK